MVTAASFALSAGLEAMARRLSLSGGLLGLIVALAGDTPEMSSAITAVLQGHHDLGLTVILGSNLFNIAAILGLAAIAGRGVAVDARYLTASGCVAALLSGIIMLVVMRLVPDVLGLALVLAVFVPYVVVVAAEPRTVRRWHLPAAARRVALALACGGEDNEAPLEGAGDASIGRWLLLLAALAMVVGGSIGMVQAAVALGQRWGIPHVVIGTFGLAALTGIPNLIGGIQLARAGHGEAAVAEALNSNSLNLVTSIAIPALFVGLPHPARHTVLVGWWAVAITLSLVVFGVWGGNLDRVKGGVLLLLYAAFVVWFVVL